ncbi:hypothetical protein LTR36_006303 [Oleoguttula mirabilis]|uniref:Uncharacterized protein n=1 Tax=Oleoguttula mirabilis TaxID=1507867 RepID=A0AAV9JC80_9PEZI|nr:hypothetical protein LTR36_006303 [Oleoguttula mirabilis]
MSVHTAPEPSLVQETTHTLEGWPQRGAKQDWSDFIPPERISILHPWISRHRQSKLVYVDDELQANPDESLATSAEISTADKEVYGGDPAHAILFRIGNGGAGYTGLLRVLAERYIATHGSAFRIGWVANHSRHTQVALLGDVVQVALTYEPGNEDMAVEEGWARRVCRAFHDHFILVGNERNSVKLEAGMPITEALSKIGKRAGSGCEDTIFHSRRDGSATYFKEQELFRAAAVNTADGSSWIHTHRLPPYEALKRAAGDSRSVYLLTDRATYLTAKRDGVIPNMRVYAEGGDELLNPCSALINPKTPSSPSQRAAGDFAAWLSGTEAQDIVQQYGKGWAHGKALFTVGAQEEFADEDRLTGLAW